MGINRYGIAIGYHLLLIIKVVAEISGIFVEAGQALHRSYPDIPFIVPADLVDHIACNSVPDVCLSIVKNMDIIAVIIIETVPGTKPDDIISVLINAVDAAVGEPAAVINLLISILGIAAFGSKQQ
jgi:hypothetical protein